MFYFYDRRTKPDDHLLSEYEQLMASIRRLSGKHWACNFCSYSAPGKDRLITHAMSNHLKIEIACPYCERKFTQRPNRRTHIKKKHGLSPREADIRAMAQAKGSLF